MERPAWAPPGIDISVPSVSRIYDYYLGGSRNFEVDRDAARRAMEFLPGLPVIMKANRAFMRRAVKFARTEGITQFLDIGCGIPSFGNVHEVAQDGSPMNRVLYVDHDPVAVEHSQAVLDGNAYASATSGDLREPRKILDSPEAAGLLDLERPVALLLVAVLHFVQDEDEPYRAVAELRDALAPGSLLVVTHASPHGVPEPPERVEGMTGVYRSLGNPLVMRAREEITRFFDGFTLVAPGLVAMPDWRPDQPDAQEDPYAFVGFGGVGRKP
ncbi:MULTISPECIES: SAM-dependent methyltransferase [unclassified Streptomyces]|uniref:SAM-dependent methyltransferase n=1 Tax=unclassified Streptomyces TaxID=2593676 RepID=UPI0004C58310|nr:SAM-dependent methyltransferase [Streptomyces sp. NRRL F-5135]